jgi:hypothetical protein
MRGGYMKKCILAAAIILAGFNSTSALAKAKSKVSVDFAFPKDRAANIVVFRPDVQVGSIGASGITSPNAEWTADGRKNLLAALEADQAKFGRKVLVVEDSEGADGKAIADYQSLSRAVSGAVFEHKFFGRKLPTKKDKFDWTLGPSANQITSLSRGNYALLLYTNDAYSTGSRKLLKAFSFLAAGSVTLDRNHRGFASLIELETGKVVWMNVDLGADGDPREPEGAAKRIENLLGSMPGRPSSSKAAK